MYMSDNSSFHSQRNLKSTVESLHQYRKQCVIKPVPSNCREQTQVANRAYVTDLEPSLDSEYKTSVSRSSIASYSENSQESLEQKDFSYSQKLFHIADGNLYSIFSPIQGRSYGMKPSFLRKQKYTVQECHSRGRKNPRKGLKFHNFLPSESVTSEKDNRFSNSKWKVHSECRLKEEHGTKQIAISNWSQSVQKPKNQSINNTDGASISEVSSAVSDHEVPLKSVSETSVPNSSNNHGGQKNPASILNCDYNWKLNSQLNAEYCEEQNTFYSNKESKGEAVQKTLPSHSSKKNSLNSLLNSLSQKSLIEKSVICDEFDSLNKNFQKHRRKPVQTRRIVPYNKYLSIMEEKETLPLDLSSKCLILSSHNATSVYDMQFPPEKSGSYLSLSNNIVAACDENVKDASDFSVEDKRFSTPNNILFNKESASEERSYNQKPSSLATLYQLPIYKNINPGKQSFVFPPPPPLIGFDNSEIGDCNNHSLQSVSEKRFPGQLNQFLPNSQFSVQKSVVKEIQPKSRRRNQRSVMKQKLEDSFRQNGFLVKTKQVSDGEATFCKFRQLRKCTRYYLKSLEQHLPDEFHKMLKGFLPPKTVLPQVQGASSSTSET